MKENRRQNKDELNQTLLQTKRTVMKQASLAAVAIVVTVVMVFAMTVAWYSNVLHTSDLTFHAKTWDFTFEGSIQMGTGNQILASPGDEGYVNLTVANVSGEANLLGQATEVANMGVTVNIDKTDLNLLRNRIYFFVEKQTDIDGETVERLYINDQDRYTYTVFAGKTLALSEDFSNDYPIKWHWVYDVTGYYVRGKLQSDHTIEIEEYLRPVEFNDSTRSLVFDDEGFIVKYGDQSIDDYLYEAYLSHDGYVHELNGFTGGVIVDEHSGSVTLNKPKATVGEEEIVLQNLVQIDENIWIVLCTEEEIKTNNELDTLIGKGQLSQEEESGFNEFSARIVLTGSKAADTGVDVESANMLVSSLNDGTSIFRLQNNLELEEALTVESGTETVIDLNGHVLTMSQTVECHPNSSITFMNGTLDAPDNTKITMINAEGAEIYLDNVISTGFYSGIEVWDNRFASDLDTHIYLSSSKISTKDSVVWLRGNGDYTKTKTTLVITECELTSSEYIAIGGNGTAEYYGTDIQVLGSTLTGFNAAVFHPMNKGTMTLKNSTLTGASGIAIKAGSVLIENCTVVATGAVEETAPSVSGFAQTGDAIYVEDNYSALHGYEIDVLIVGKDTFVKSTNHRAVYWNDGTAEKAGLAVYAGKYMSSETDDDYMNLFQSTYLASGKEATLLSDGSIEVNDAPAALPQTE